MRRIFVWLYMLNKRLYKRVTYIGILLLIFASVCAFAVVSRNDSGFVHIALSRIEGEDNTSTLLIQELLQEDSILRFTYIESPEEGIKAVKTGRVDAVWIFPESFESTEEATPVVRVVEREQTVFLRLAREKLHGLLFEGSAKALFLRYSRENLPVLDAVSDKELLTYFENCKIDEELFIGDSSIDPTEGDTSIGYLTAPLRGLLAIVCVLAGMAGVLYYMQDEERKIFSNLPEQKRPFVAMMGIFVSALNVGVISLLALWGSGLYDIGLWEILNALLLSVCTVAFSMVLMELFCSIGIFGAMIPTVITAMSVLCPVFFNLRSAKLLAHMFPPTYYIHSAYDRTYILYMCAYSCLCLLLTHLIRVLKKR